MDLRRYIPVLREGEEAQEIASAQKDLTMGSGGQQDALRHALWNAKMTQNYGPMIAGMAGSGLEAFEVIKALRHPGAVRQRQESKMDVENNLRGIAAGLSNSPEALVEALRQKALKGELSTLPQYDWKTNQEVVDPNRLK